MEQQQQQVTFLILQRSRPGRLPHTQTHKRTHTRTRTPQVSLPTQYNGKNQDPVGALSSALARLQANRPLRELREVAKGLSKQLPQPLQVATSKLDEYARGMISGSGSTLFEELGLYYIGPVDGHNVDDLVAVLAEVKAAETVRRQLGGWCSCLQSPPAAAASQQQQQPARQPL